MDLREAFGKAKRQESAKIVKFLRNDRVRLRQRRGYIPPGERGEIVEMFPGVAIVRFDFFPDETHEFKIVAGEIEPDRLVFD